MVKEIARQTMRNMILRLNLQPLLKYIVLSIITLCLRSVVATEPSRTAAPCEKAPPHAQPADDSYRLKISGDPDFFLPGVSYIVTIQGVNTGGGPTPFQGFELWAEPGDEVTPTDDEGPAADVSLGTLQPHDELTKPHELCKEAVANATSHPKTDVQVMWNAPIRAPSTCVRLCARLLSSRTQSASVLARTVCAAPATLPQQPSILEPCCACDEANYEVSFESVWSQNTHLSPESAPVHAHFSELIGASHSARGRVWREGRAASPGLRSLAQSGATTALEKELKAQSDNIRTIIKAKGITWQEISGSGAPKTSAVFRADAKNHLVSLVSKLSPSPGWIVGVSALELCNQNCTWTSSITWPLYPYDAGADEGTTYSSRPNPKLPPAPVRPLSLDTGSSLYNATGEMRPFARLHLRRIQLFQKSCDAQTSDETGTSDAESECATTAWGAWGACSAACGRGRAARRRQYARPERARARGCRAPLLQRAPCRKRCSAVPDETRAPCALSPWSEWGRCAGCVRLVARARRYVAPRARRRCRGADLAQVKPCHVEPGLCPGPPLDRIWTSNELVYADLPSPPCEVGPWGEWSACSSGCGRGRRVRSRLYLMADERAQAEMTRRLTYIWQKSFAELQGLEIPEENIRSPDPEIDAIVQDQMDKCHYRLSQEETFCDGDDENCTRIDSSKDVCKLPLDVGYCRKYRERWFYDSGTGTCEPFGFTGCGGNDNNFATHLECQKFCMNVTSDTSESTVVP